MYSIFAHVTEAVQSSNDILAVSFASTISAILLYMVIIELSKMEYMAEIVMVGLGIALLLLNAGLLGYIAWALSQGLGASLGFDILTVVNIINAADTASIGNYVLFRALLASQGNITHS